MFAKIKWFFSPEFNKDMAGEVGEAADLRHGIAQLEPAPAAAATAPMAETRYPIEFTAKAGEYFRVWIVNLALTIVTLGIYSAWAKVRKRRYLYSHTRIAGECFEYLAKPLPILKGRLIALAFLVAAYFAIRFSPAVPTEPGLQLLRKFADNLVFVAVFVFAGPWVIVRAYRFNAHNTAYRSIRLRFNATYTDCLKLTAKYGWLLIFGFTYPWVKRILVDFVARNHYYGTTKFTVRDFKEEFVGAY